MTMTEEKAWHFQDGTINFFSQTGREHHGNWYVTMHGSSEFRIKPTKFSNSYKLEAAIAEANSSGLSIEIAPADAVLLFLEGVIRLEDLEASTLTAEGLELSITLSGALHRIIILDPKAGSS